MRLQTSYCCSIFRHDCVNHDILGGCLQTEFATLNVIMTLSPDLLPSLTSQQKLNVLYIQVQNMCFYLEQLRAVQAVLLLVEVQFLAFKHYSQLNKFITSWDQTPLPQCHYDVKRNKISLEMPPYLQAGMSQCFRTFSCGCSLTPQIINPWGVIIHVLIISVITALDQEKHSVVMRHLQTNFGMLIVIVTLRRRFQPMMLFQRAL